MGDYALIQIAQAIAPGLIAIGAGAVVLGVGIAIRGLAGGSRRRLNDLTERVLDLEDQLRRVSASREIPERPMRGELADTSRP